MKNQKTIIAIVAIALVAGIIWYVFFRTKPATTASSPAINPPAAINSTLAASAAPAANDTLPLTKGSKGENVTYVQQAINKIHPGAVTVDGDFGAGTYMALITYVGTSFYPVTSTKFSELLQKANNI